MTEVAKIKTSKWDVVDYLNTEEEMALYLSVALEEDDVAFFNIALGDVARAKGMSEVARAAGLGRESLYKGLSEQGNPEFATVLKVLRALGLGLTVAPLADEARAAAEA
jgi:probable addiction module antidote protein